MASAERDTMAMIKAMIELMKAGKDAPDSSLGDLCWALFSNHGDRTKTEHQRDTMEVIKTMLQFMTAGKEAPDSSQGDLCWTLNEKMDPNVFGERIPQAYHDYKYYGTQHKGWMDINDIFKSIDNLKYTPILSGSLLDGTIMCLTRKMKFDFDCMFCYNGVSIKPSNIRPVSKERSVYVNLDATNCPELIPFITESKGFACISAKKFKSSLSALIREMIKSLRPNSQTDIDKHFHPDQSVACITMGKLIEYFADEEMASNSEYLGNDLTALLVSTVALPIISKTFDVELVPSLVCEQWPQSNFLTRRRPQNWPSSETLLNLKKNVKVYLIPKCHLGGNDETQWRFSFSESENILSYRMSKFHRQCLSILKNILHDITTNRKIPEVGSDKIVCSYHLKTVVYWALEQDDLLWDRQENLGEVVAHLLVKLVKCIRERNLPHYFMPEYNLFLDVQEEDLIKLKVQQEPDGFDWEWRPSKLMPMLPAIYQKHIDKHDPLSKEIPDIANELVVLAIQYLMDALKAKKNVNCKEMAKCLSDDMFAKVLKPKDYAGHVVQAIMRGFTLLFEEGFKIINTMKSVSEEEQFTSNNAYADIELD